MGKKDYEQSIAKLRNAIDAADAIAVGAGAGLSTAAGLTYSGERFERDFGDFIKMYRFRDMYSAGFFPFTTLEEQWVVATYLKTRSGYQAFPQVGAFIHFTRVIYSPYLATTLVATCWLPTGYHPGSHLLATNWLPPGEAYSPDVVSRDSTSRTTRHEMDGFSGFATIEWELYLLKFAISRIITSLLLLFLAIMRT